MPPPNEKKQVDNDKKKNNRLSAISAANYPNASKDAFGNYTPSKDEIAKRQQQAADTAGKLQGADRYRAPPSLSKSLARGTSGAVGGMSGASSLSSQNMNPGGPNYSTAPGPVGSNTNKIVARGYAGMFTPHEHKMKEKPKIKPQAMGYGSPKPTLTAKELLSGQYMHPATKAFIDNITR